MVVKTASVKHSIFSPCSKRGIRKIKPAPCHSRQLHKRVPAYNSPQHPCPTFITLGTKTILTKLWICKDRRGTENKGEWVTGNQTIFPTFICKNKLCIKALLLTPSR